ncbi:MAG: glycerate kinase [Bacteroidetes bacterium]|nr:glycerate kinase [Bacteroidota bacterium]
MNQILIAPNAFKNSLDAALVAEAIKEGLTQSKLSCRCICLPVGDGGDGTASLLAKQLNAVRIESLVRNPIGKKIKACLWLIEKDQTAIIELADASGLRLLTPAEYSPLHANTCGTGDLIKLALDKGAKKIIIGIGGSATIDVGAGIMQALGIRFFDDAGNELQPSPSSFIHLNRIDLTGMDKRINQSELVVLCDVKNRLLGKEGAAVVFGPQKGAKATDVDLLDNALLKLSELVFKQTGKDMSTIEHGGAAGGVAAGLSAVMHARLVNGIEYFLDHTGFDALLENTDMVITGEGSIDQQTLQGKAPFGVAKRAKAKKIPVLGIAGHIPLQTDSELEAYFDALISISHKPMDVLSAMHHTRENVVRTARMLGNLLSL